VVTRTRGDNLGGRLKPPFFEALTDVDKAKLEELKAMDIDMSQTAVGRLKN
jgi:hypothetical protein